jgi:hypothetical protein
MDKYLCVCGMGFKKAQQAHDHVQAYIDSESAWPHQVIKRKWRGRFLDFLINTRRYWKLAGIMIIYFTVINHFGIKFNLWEGLAMGIGMGLAIE